MSSAPDDVLQLLRQRGGSPDPSALDSLMRGVAAAPEGLAGPEWVELVAPGADAELTRALRLDPESYEANSRAAAIYYEDGRFEDAARYFSQAAALNETSFGSAAMMLSALTAEPTNN